MVRKFFPLLAAVALAGFMSACGPKADTDDYAMMDHDWNASDSAFLVDYNAVKSQDDSLQTMYTTWSTMPPTGKPDTAMMAQRADMQKRLAMHKQSLMDMDAKRMAAKAKMDAARTAKDKAAYEAARKEVDYTIWNTDIKRMRTEQGELQGMMKIGDKSVGAVDVNMKDKNKPLLRVEPGKKDDKPLIEMNKNPK